MLSHSPTRFLAVMMTTIAPAQHRYYSERPRPSLIACRDMIDSLRAKDKVTCQQHVMSLPCPTMLLMRKKVTLLGLLVSILQPQSKRGTSSDFDYLLNAANEVVQARELLRHSYVAAYFMEWGAHKR